MTSLVERINGIGSQPQKSYTWDMFSLLGGGYSGTRDGQLIATTWGATLAYYKIPAVKSSVDFIAENASIVPIVERDSQGNEIARSDKNPENSPVIHAIQEAYSWHGVPFIQEWVSARLLYGMNFIQLVRNPVGYVRGLRWLNPNAVSIHAPHGEIEGYYYGAQNEDIPHRMGVNDVVYSRGFNPGDDIYGYSPTLNVMSKVNITLDFDRFTISYYRNAGQPGMAVSFRDPVPIEEARKLADLWRQEFRGVDNFFRTHISHKPLEYNQFEPLDISKPLEVSQNAERGIYKGYRVAPELLGDTENNPYQFSDETKNASMQTVVKPHLDAVSNAINNRIMPFFAPKGHTIGFDLSAWETVSADIISADVQSGLTSLNEGASKRGYKPNPKLADIYMVNGRPMHISVIQQVAMEVPPEYQAPRPTQFEMVRPEPAALPTGEPEAESESAFESLNKAIDPAQNQPAFAYIPLSNHTDIVRAQRELKLRFDDDRIEWQTAPTFHVTLCHAEVMEDQAVEKLSTLIHPEQIELQPVQGEQLDYFDTPDGKALHIPILLTSSLVAVQADVYSAFTSEGHDVSAFSKPESWKPHITLAYIPNDVLLNMDALRQSVEWLDSVVIETDTVIIGRDDYEPALILTAPNYIRGLQPESCHHTLPHHKLFTEDILYDLDAMDTATGDELRIWYKYARGRNSTEFRCKFDSTVLEPYIRHAVIDRIEALPGDGDLSVAIIDVLQDDILKTVASYRRQARSILNQFWNDRIGFSDATLAMTRLIEQQFDQAFRRGLSRGSLTLNDLDSQERGELNTLIMDEKTYVLNLINDIYRARTEGTAKIADFRNRMELWIARYDHIEERGFVIAARNARLRWDRNPAKESCDDCIVLDGMVKLAKTWKEAGVVPKSPRLKCFGSFCGCGFKIMTADVPLSKGKIPAIG